MYRIIVHEPGRDTNDRNQIFHCVRRHTELLIGQRYRVKEFSASRPSTPFHTCAGSGHVDCEDARDFGQGLLLGSVDDSVGEPVNTR
jgi:hypothetical protein